MGNSIVKTISWEHFFLFVCMIILMLCSWRVCLPVSFSVLFFYTMNRQNILPVLVIFSICYDAYIGNIPGVAWCMFMTAYLLVRHCRRVLPDSSIFRQAYYFLLMIFSAEFTGILIALFLHGNTNIITHLVEIARTLSVFFTAYPALHAVERWKNAKAQ